MNTYWKKKIERIEENFEWIVNPLEDSNELKQMSVMSWSI